MAAAPPPPSRALGSIEALKRVKATETDWESKLRAAHSAADEAIARLKADSEEAVKAAQASAEAERALAVQAARIEADHEAAAILAEGTQAAQAATQGEGKRARDRKDDILSTVLAGFGKD